MLSLNDLNFRKIEPDDLEMILYWRNSTEVRKYMLNDNIILLEDHLKWFKKISNDKSFDILVTEYKSTPVGIVSISELDFFNRTCTWGQYIGANIRNSGIGILMQIKAIDRMVNEHKIRKIWGKALGSNRILKIHEVFGFINEGVLKDHIKRNNVYENIFLVALFADFWPQKRNQLIKKYKLQ